MCGLLQGLRKKFSIPEAPQKQPVKSPVPPEEPQAPPPKKKDFGNNLTPGTQEAGRAMGAASTVNKELVLDWKSMSHQLGERPSDRLLGLMMADMQGQLAPAQVPTGPVAQEGPGETSEVIELCKTMREMSAAFAKERVDSETKHSQEIIDLKNAELERVTRELNSKSILLNQLNAELNPEGGGNHAGGKEGKEEAKADHGGEDGPSGEQGPQRGRTKSARGRRRG